MAIVDIANPAPYRSGVDISMFIRTRQQDGFIFYFGSDVEIGGGSNPNSLIVEQQQRATSYSTGQLLQGNLVISVRFDGKQENFRVYTVDLSDG